MSKLITLPTMCIVFLLMPFSGFNTFDGFNSKGSQDFVIKDAPSYFGQRNHKKIAFGAALAQDIKQQHLEDNYKIKTVVLDAGHGGKDDGASGAFTKEKNIALQITLKVGAYLKANFPDLNIVYTRSTDEFIPLYERADIANKAKADLFLSFHCNAHEMGSSAKGMETYVMGLHTAEENLQVAKRENAAILLEKDYKEHYGGFDPNSPEGHIMLSMYQSAYLEQSINFAAKMHHKTKQNKQHSRGVKQAGFVVLRATAMPSVLIETGFITNTREEKYLNSSEGQSKIAQNVLASFIDYKKELEKESTQITVEPKQIKPESKVEDKIALAKQNNIMFFIVLEKSSKPLDLKKPPFDKLEDFKIIKNDKEFYYVTPGSHNYTEILESCKKHRDNGFPNAKVIVEKDKKAIPLDKALDILGWKS